MAIYLAFKAGELLLQLVAGQPQPRIVSVDTRNADRDTYEQFLQNIRRVVASEDIRHGIPVMRNPGTVPNNERYFFVQLQNVRGLTITLALDVTDLYVVGYRAGDRSYFFRNHYNAASPYVFMDIQQQQQHTLPFDSLYGSMEADAGNTHDSGRNPQRSEQEVSRATIDLGIHQLDAAITRLHDKKNNRSTLARSLIVIIQMVSEAARFGYIQDLVLDSIPYQQTFRPDSYMLRRENCWGRLCEAVQLSDSGQIPQDLQLVLQRPNSTESVTRPLNQELLIMRFVERKQVNPHHEF